MTDATNDTTAETTCALLRWAVDRGVLTENGIWYWIDLLPETWARRYESL
jgi:hypothetical protein